jgi:hypothetical protein
MTERGADSFPIVVIKGPAGHCRAGTKQSHRTVRYPILSFLLLHSDEQRQKADQGLEHFFFKKG